LRLRSRGKGDQVIQALSRVSGGVRFDWVMAMLSAVFVGGPFLDGWAHTHGRVDQSFFTPGHAVFYAGHAAAMGFLTFQGAYPVALVIAAGAGGVLADLLRAWLRPMVGRPATWRLFAFVVPAVFYCCYFVALIATKGIAWSVHLWTGSIMLAGLTGWLLNYLVLPSRSSDLAPGGL
jgi:hypothetical protein